jgi:hypothetical protein
MEEVELYWYGPYKVDLFRLEDIADDVMGVYMFLDSEHHEDRSTWTHHQILYIGMVYEQTFDDRLGQHLRGDDVWKWIQGHHEFEVMLKAARIGLLSRERISRELVQAIESLLIGVMQPPGNIQSTQTYTRQALRIRNLGKFKPLRSYLSTSDLA